MIDSDRDPTERQFAEDESADNIDDADNVDNIDTLHDSAW